MHTCNEKLPNTEEIKMIINMEKRTEMKCNEKRMNKSKFYYGRREKKNIEIAMFIHTKIHT